MIIILKANGKVSIYVDHTKLNKHVKHDLHILTTVDHLLAQLGEAKVMNKGDVNSGYWQIPLSSESHALMTFISPFRRYHFGISSASEVYMSQVLEDEVGAICMQEDVLIYSKDQHEYDA